MSITKENRESLITMFEPLKQNVDDIVILYERYGSIIVQIRKRKNKKRNR